MVYELRMLLEVVVLAMFKNHYCTGFQQAVSQHEVGQAVYVGKSIWRVCKNKVEFLVARLQKSEYIASDKNIARSPNLAHALSDEGRMVAVGLNAYH